MGKTLLRNVTVLTSGSAISRAIAFASLPLITRIYAPDDFGQFSMFVATLGIMIPFATLRYTSAVPLPRSDAMAANLVAVSLATTVAISLTVLLVVAILMAASAVLPALDLPGSYWVLAPGLLGAAVFETFRNWAVRRKQFNAISKALVWQSFLAAIAKIGLGLLGLRALGLIIGHVISLSAGVAGIAGSLRQDIRKAFGAVRPSRARLALSRYIEFPKHRLPAQILLALSAQLPVLFVGAYYGDESVGFLGLTLSCISLPVALVGYSLGQIYFGEIAGLGKGQPEKARSLTKTFISASAGLIVVPVIALLTFGPELFGFIFGSEWAQAGVFAQILAVYLGIQFCAVPVIHSFSVFGRQASFLTINGVRVMLIGGVFAAAYLLDLDIVGTLWIFSIVLSLHYLYVIASVFKMVNKECSESA